jgi:hypothetical protein
VIAAAALCPWPPLLVRELTGADPVLPELRSACAAAVATMLAAGPEAVAVVAPGPQTGQWPGDGRLDVAAFGGWPVRAGDTTRPVLPPAAGIGAYLLDQAGYQGPRLIWTVSEGEPASGCAGLGAELAGLGGSGQRTGLLVLGDGSARRGPRAPGYVDERAAAFDDAWQRAIRAGDLPALLDVDPGLARELMATGRPAWQVLAGACPGPLRTVDVGYAGDPFGVMYLVASLVPSAP